MNFVAFGKTSQRPDPHPLEHDMELVWIDDAGKDFLLGIGSDGHK